MGLIDIKYAIWGDTNARYKGRVKITRRSHSSGIYKGGKKRLLEIIMSVTAKQSDGTKDDNQSGSRARHDCLIVQT